MILLCVCFMDFMYKLEKIGFMYMMYLSTLSTKYMKPTPNKTMYTE